MAHIPDFMIQVLSGEELVSYVPDVRYWILRDLLRIAPSNSMRTDDERRANLVVVRIEFCNLSNESIEFGFQNISCKAELMSLEFQDNNRTVIPPVRGVHVRPKPDAYANSLTIMPINGKIVYDLVGEVVDGWIVFPGARYQIPENRSLHVMFKYKGKLSNSVELNF